MIKRVKSRTNSSFGERERIERSSMVLPSHDSYLPCCVLWALFQLLSCNNSQIQSNSFFQSYNTVTAPTTQKYEVGEITVCYHTVQTLFHFIYQFFPLLKITDVLERCNSDVVGGLFGEESLMGGHDNVWHHQQQSQLVIIDHPV